MYSNCSEGADVSLALMGWSQGALIDKRNAFSEGKRRTEKAIATDRLKRKEWQVNNYHV